MRLRPSGLPAAHGRGARAVLKASNAQLIFAMIRFDFSLSGGDLCMIPRAASYLFTKLL